MANNYLDQLKLPNNSIYYLRDNEAIGSITRTGDSLIVANRVGTQTVIPNTDFDTINVTELNAGNLIVTGAARFLNTINGSISGQSGSVANSLVIQLNSGTTEGTNKFTYNGSASKTVNITKSSIGLGNVENKSSATIRGEITSSNVTTALGYTPLNKAGDTMTGPLKFGDQAIPQFSGSPSYILGIEAFASGGDVKWQSASSVSVGSSTKATQDESGNNIKSSYGASLGQDSSDGHKIFLKNKNGTQIGSTITIPDNNTTYTFAESSSNGYFTVTPSGGSAQSVKIHGLGTAAFKNTTDTYSETGTDPVTGKALKQALDGLPEPMVFKGTVGSSSATYTWDQLPTPSASNEGWTFKAIEDHSTAPICKSGDTLISNGSEWVIVPSGDEPSGTVTSVAIANGGGLSVSGSPITSSGTITISHSDTSSQASVSNSGRTYIQSVTLDTYGHVTKLTSATETVTDTNYYHKTGTWSGLTYTAAKVGSPDDLAFTIPTGTTATTVAVGNHSHDGTYVKTSGDTMTGNLTFSKPTTAGQKRGFVFAGVTDSAGLYYLEPSLSDDGRMRFVISDNDTDPIEMAWSLYRQSGSEIPGEHVVHSFNARGYTLTPIQEASGAYDAISITCSVNNHGTIGSSTNKWKAVYATTFYGDVSGSATSLTTNDGSATNPVYFSGGVPVACTYSLNKTVPSDAVFTDTTYSAGDNMTLSSTTFYATKRWNAVTQGQKWSRIMYVAPTYSTEGTNGILAVSCTRANVVCNATFIVSTSHASVGKISLIGSTNYSNFNIRVVVNSGGSFYFEIDDTANNIASGTTQTWHCSYLPLMSTTVTVYTTFTDGTTIPSGFTACNQITTVTGDGVYGIRDITRSGTTFTATRSNGTTFTFTQQDSNDQFTLGTSDNNVVLSKNGTAQNTITVPYATKAAQDESGNNIKATYMSSLSVASNVATFKNKNGTSLGTVTASTTSIGSASAGTAISADDITSWSAGTLPTLGTAISADDITAWDAGSTPTLGTAISADDITAWSAGTMFSASFDGKCTLTLTSGSVPTLSYTGRSIPNVTSVGSVPSLSYTARSIPNVTSVGTLPDLKYTARSIPNISVSSKTVVTGIS